MIGETEIVGGENRFGLYGNIEARPVNEAKTEEKQKRKEGLVTLLLRHYAVCNDLMINGSPMKTEIYD